MLRRTSRVRTFSAPSDLRDPQYLAEVFDRTARPLLRLAIHLVGDPAVAEDLVQDTFLGALEAADRYDPRQPIEPWLRGILLNRFRRRARTDARKPEAERLAKRVAETPAEEALHTEQSAALAQAIDGLDSPYREILLLRMRHGMAPADIAHVLGRTSGTVRVQLHRGLEQLRRALPGVAVFALLGMSARRGLAAVRTVVIEQTQAASTGVAVVTGGVLMGKVILAGALAVAALIGLFLWSPWNPGTASIAESRSFGSGVLTGHADPMKPTLQGRTAPQDESASLPTGEEIQFEGIVIDGSTGEGAADVRLAFHAPLPRRTLRQIQARFPGRLHIWPDGRPLFYSTTPLALGPLTAAQRLSVDPVPVVLEPEPGATPQTQTVTDAEGRFTLTVPEEPGILVVEKTGYGRLLLPTRAGATALELRIEPLRPLTGQVQDADGSPVAGFTLLLTNGWTSFPLGVGDDAPQRERTVGATAAVEVTTDPDGTFAANIAAAWVLVRPTRPGHRITRGSERDNPGGVAVALSPAGTFPSLELVAHRMGVLRVRDAVTRAPIERLFVAGRDTTFGHATFAGARYAHGGDLRLLDANATSRFGRQGCELHIWAPGYQPTKVVVRDLLRETVDVQLQPGACPRISGRLSAGAKPLVGARVSLTSIARPSLGLSPADTPWSGDETRWVAAAASDAAGAFALEAPAGTYVLTARAGGDVRHRRVAIPDDDGLSIDFLDPTGVDVRILGPSDAPRPEHTCRIKGPDGRRGQATSDETGALRFDGLIPGTYTLSAPRSMSKNSAAGQVVEDVTLGAGERRTITLTVPAKEFQVFLRLTCDRAVDLAAWRARTLDSDEWCAVLADGTVPIPLNTSVSAIEVDTRNGHRFHVPIQRGGTSIERKIRLDGPRLEGRLIDPATGSPWPGVRVVAQGDQGIRSSAITDDDGHFVLPCASTKRRTLTFNSEIDRHIGNRHKTRFAACTFSPTARPSLEPTPMTVGLRDLERVERVTLQGRVMRKTSSTPMPGKRVSFTPVFEDEHGVLHVAGHAGRTDAQGHFSADLPRAPRYAVAVTSMSSVYWSGTWELPAGRSLLERDILVVDRTR